MKEKIIIIINTFNTRRTEHFGYLIRRNRKNLIVVVYLPKLIVIVILKQNSIIKYKK